MINKTDIEAYLEQHNYDIRLNNNGRWIDQKCTPDVICIIADCVLDFVNQNDYKGSFTSKDIWHSNYAETNVREIFNKPSTSSVLSQNEYDKFFAQPLEMLANAGILKKWKEGVRNYYSVDNSEILEYISLRERNALTFTTLYCEKVLKDSGLWSYFEEFFQNQTKEEYLRLKERFESFIIENTKINGTTEVRRIFTKVLNPLANKYQKRGTKRGLLSSDTISYSELMYNRANFRDIYSDKPKGVTRTEWSRQHPQQVNVQLYKYQSTKAKKALRLYNDSYRNSRSEFIDEYSSGPAIHMHHIFPEHQFPEISMYLENLIALTPTQHLTKAHPKGRTQQIDFGYQELLLKAKAGIIEDYLSNTDNDGLYSFENFITVLNVGFDEDNEVNENDFIGVMNVITNHYFEVEQER
jgi:type II R-M system restriction endonuclease